jgi:hypothetical protein
MDRNSREEAEIHRFGGCKISITKSSEMNSKTTLEPSTAPRWHPKQHIFSLAQISSDT